MNSVQQHAAFAEDFASLIRWIRQCGQLPVIVNVENMSVQTKIFSHDSYQEVDQKVYEEMGAYWATLHPLNKYKSESDILKFERKEVE